MVTSRRYGMLLGVVSGVAGLAASELISGWLHQRVSPLVAVSEGVIRLTPGAVIEPVISLVGTNDKPFLIGLTVVLMVALSAVAGAVAMRSVLAAQGVFLLLGVVVLLAVGTRLSSSSTTYVPAIVGIVTSLVLVSLLAPKAHQAAAVRPGEGDSVAGARHEASRRRFLVLAGVVGVGAVVAGSTGRFLASGRAAVEAARSKLKLPVRGAEAPSGVELGVRGVAPWMTSQDKFYRIDTALAVPQILPQNWELRVHGMVDREVKLTYQDLLDRGLQQAWLTLCCVSNPIGGSDLQRGVVRHTDRRRPRRGRCPEGRGRGEVDVGGRLDLRHTDCRPHRRPQRAVRRGHERRASHP